MTILRLARPRNPASWPRRMMELRVPGGGVMGGSLVLAWILLCTLLALVPRWWLAERVDRDQQAWFAQARNKAGRLVQEWEHWTSPVPDFSRGDEASVKAWLTKEPLVEAVVDLTEGGVWLREQDHLRRPVAPSEGEHPATLVRKALEATSRNELAPRPGEGSRIQGLQADPTNLMVAWWPVPLAFVTRRESPTIITFDRRWALIKRWVSGSPQVERWLKGTLRPGDDYRFGLTTRYDLVPRSFDTFADPRQFLGTPSAEFRNPDDAPFFIDHPWAHSFTGASALVLQMTPGTYQRLWLTHRLRTRMTWLAYGLGVGVSGLALALYILSRHWDRLRADRTAALAHSLKTPLAVLQSRCDTVLNPDLPEATRQAHLLNIGQEVRHLVRLIESGLEGTRPEARELDLVEEAFLEALDEEMSPAFEARGRLLEVYSARISFHSRASRLRTALVTLLENALLHGQGCVELRAIQEPGRVLFSVQDEGEGLPGLAQDSQGQGLRLLRQMARAEGWGLTLENLEPGFRASLEIPT